MIEDSWYFGVLPLNMKLKVSVDTMTLAFSTHPSNQDFSNPGGLQRWMRCPSRWDWSAGPCWMQARRPGHSPDPEEDWGALGHSVVLVLGGTGWSNGLNMKWYAMPIPYLPRYCMFFFMESCHPVHHTLWWDDMGFRKHTWNSRNPKSSDLSPLWLITCHQASRLPMQPNYLNQWHGIAVEASL